MNLPHSLIEPALRLAQDRLSSLCESATELNLQRVFSVGFDFEGAINWLKIESQQNFSHFPTLEIIASQQINYAQGAYAAESNTIYLAAELIEQSNSEAISRVILEEYGHYLDAWFNSTDTPGDEGELFAHYVQNQQLTPAELSRIQSENDFTTVKIAESPLVIEQSNLGDNPAFDLIGLTQLRNDPQFAGIDGSGFSIAVIDTGLDTDHRLIADNYVAGYDFIDGDDDPTNQERHGTHVTGILGSTDETIGVAPDVGLISLRALNREGEGSLDKIADALEWVLDNRTEYNITAVNLSLGGGFFDSESELDQSSLAAESNRLRRNIQNLETAGVTVVAAAGNNYFRNESQNSRQNLAFPAIASTIAVGAVWRDGLESTTYWQDGSIDYSTGADRITGFSQRLDAENVIFAPGAIITSTIPGGGIGESAGTSEATPHVAGAVALMQEAALEFGDRLLTPTEVNDILRTTADTIIDGDDEDDNVNNTNLAYLRINIYSAISEIKRRADNDIADSDTEDSREIVLDQDSNGSNDTIANAETISLAGNSATAVVRETIGRDGTENRRNDVD
ncbi:MAG: S8 family serine peptidase, partial [Cyanobacteria bacterium J06600_6]